MKHLKYYIKERHNPQLGVYYTSCGQMTKKDAKLCEQTVYGTNIMHSYKTELDYKNAINKLVDAGEKVYAN